MHETRAGRLEICQLWRQQREKYDQDGDQISDISWRLSALGRQRGNSSNLATAKAYVHAYWKPGMRWTDLQFWFFYAYNGPGTAHRRLLSP